MSHNLPAAPSGFSHRFATAKGLRFHYVECSAPEGFASVCPTIVLLAGFPESWYAWRKIMGVLREGTDCRILAIDLPGQGDSDRPQDGYDTQTVATRVHDLLQHLDVTRYALAAHDVGAWVAFPYALLYPNEVQCLTLLDAGIPGITLPSHLPTSSTSSWKTWHFGFHAVPDLPEILLQGRERPYLEWFLGRKSADPTVYSEEDIDEYLRVFTSPGGMRAGLAFYRANATSEQQNRALTENAKVNMPVLALSADQGSIPDMEAALKPFCQDIRGETIRDCGHFQLEERPEAVADAIVRFIRSC
ncbi:hypothetical protein HKX48_008650 [Thoreauomyces humboldtii]|nr:hypothetical protein HKX48_008650 [Thoreauomyces humboldtii]